MHTHGPGCLQGPLSRGPQWRQETASRRESDPLPADRDGRPSEEAPIRTDLVERVRREIAQGTYDTPEKFEAALEEMLRRLDGD